MHIDTLWALTIGVIVVFVLLGIICLIPTPVRPKKQKKERPQKQEEENKDWQAVSLTLEKHIVRLNEEAAGLRKVEKSLERDLIVQKEKYKKLQEKSAQERGWQEKEEEDSDKKNKHILQLRENIKSLEEKLEQEIAKRLRYEHEARESADDAREARDKSKTQDLELLKLRAHIDNYRSELAELRDMNQKLTKKQADTTWIAKSEYDKLEKQFKELEKELAALKKSAGP